MTSKIENDSDVTPNLKLQKKNNKKEITSNVTSLLNTECKNSFVINNNINNECLLNLTNIQSCKCDSLSFFCDELNGKY